MTFRLLRPSIICLMILATPAIFAQDKAAEIDVEIAPTPLEMAELLPDGDFEMAELLPDSDIDKLAYDFYLMALPGQGEDAKWGARYMRFTAKIVDGKLVLSRIFGIDFEGEWVNTTRLTFNSRGEFEDYRYQQSALRIAFGADLIEQYDGAPYFGSIYAKRTQITRNTFGRKKGEIKTQFDSTRFTLPEATGAVSGTWMPAIFAYHIRQKHPVYSFTVTEPVATSRQSEFLKPPTQYLVEDVGTESIVFDDQQRIAHVLLVGPKNDGDERKVRVRISEKGEIFSIEPVDPNAPYYGPFESDYLRVTPAQFAEILGVKLDENGDPPLSWLDKNEG